MKVFMHIVFCRLQVAMKNKNELIYETLQLAVGKLRVLKMFIPSQKLRTHHINTLRTFQILTSLLAKITVKKRL